MYIGDIYGASTQACARLLARPSPARPPRPTPHAIDVDY